MCESLEHLTAQGGWYSPSFTELAEAARAGNALTRPSRFARTANVFDGVTTIYDGLGRAVERGNNGAYTQVVYSPTGDKLAFMNGQSVQQYVIPFAGTHELEAIFTRQALELEQWRSRFHAGQALPGISEQEAAEIVHSELGLGLGLELSQPKIRKLIAKSRITDLRHGSQHSCVSARRLFWVLRELQAGADGAEKIAARA